MTTITARTRLRFVMVKMIVVMGPTRKTVTLVNASLGSSGALMVNASHRGGPVIKTMIAATTVMSHPSTKNVVCQSTCTQPTRDVV